MSNLYSKQHYKDVAEILRTKRDAGLEALGGNQGSDAIARVMLVFADLFAEDNPPTCINCGEPNTTTEVCVTDGGRCWDEHNFEGGFNRKLFLEACGLEPKN